MKKFYVLIIMVVGMIGYQCSTVAVTGRRQLSLIPDAEILPLSAGQYSEVIGASKLSTNQQQVDMVKRVGRRIQRAVEV